MWSHRDSLFESASIPEQIEFSCTNSTFLHHVKAGHVGKIQQGPVVVTLLLFQAHLQWLPSLHAWGTTALVIGC